MNPTPDNSIHDVPKFRNYIMISLMKGPCYVMFEKKDGSVRHMTCTLHNKLIPQDHKEVDHSANKTYKQRSDKTISAWDLDKKEWRSFIVENVKFFSEVNKTGGEKND